LKVALFANTEWYLFNFRLPLAKALVKAGHEVVLISPPGPYGEKLAAAGFRWIAFPLNRAGTNPFGELGTLLRLISLYRKERFDLVHHFTIKCVIYGGIAARLSSAMSVAAITGLGHVFTTYSLKNRLLGHVLRPLYRSALGQARVIFQNPDDMSTFLALGLVAEHQCHLIRGSGVNTQRFAPLEITKQNEPGYVLFVGRLLREKGIFEFIDAARMLAQRLPQTRFVVAGTGYDGNPSSVSPAQLLQWQSIPNVTFLGHVDDMLPLYHGAAMAVLPSYREGTPRSLLEAAACALPLIAADASGSREVCRQAEIGLLVPLRDSNALAEAIFKLAQDSKLRAAYGRSARRMAVEEFDESIVISSTIEVYQWQGELRQTAENAPVTK